MLEFLKKCTKNKIICIYWTPSDNIEHPKLRSWTPCLLFFFSTSPSLLSSFFYCPNSFVSISFSLFVPPRVRTWYLKKVESKRVDVELECFEKYLFLFIFNVPTISFSLFDVPFLFLFWVVPFFFWMFWEVSTQILKWILGFYFFFIL